MFKKQRMIKMRDKKRIKPLLDELEKLWNKCPDMRFGQLIENYLFPTTFCSKGAHVYLFHQEDHETIKAIKERSGKMKK